MEVKAAEIITSDDFEMGHTLRFPRAVVPIREDKDWCDACTENHLREFLSPVGRLGLGRRRQPAKVVKEEVDSADGDTGDEKESSSGPATKKARRGGMWGAGGPS